MQTRTALGLHSAHYLSNCAYAYVHEFESGIHRHCTMVVALGREAADAIFTVFSMARQGPVEN